MSNPKGTAGLGRPIIEACGLCKSFVSKQRSTAIRAVDRLELAVQQGETFGLIGADGAGKTTTLRLLNGLLVPDEGAARVAGFDSVSDYRRIHQIAGYMPQRFALYGDLSVVENLFFFGQAHGITFAEQHSRIPRLLRFAHLEEFRDRLASRLSGGMKKKLALACMLIHEPELVFLDEPTLGVDPVARREFWNLLSDLRAEKGLTVFVCTPYMDEAERCNRVGLMHQGRLIACDTPQAIRKMLPGELIELRTSSLFAARDVARKLDGVLEVQNYGELLHIFVDDAERRGAEIEAALGAHGITVHAARRIEPRMEEAFVSLVTRLMQRAKSDEERP